MDNEENCIVEIDEDTAKIINDNYMTKKDLAKAICLQLRKYGLCPCPLSNIIKQHGQSEPLKLEHAPPSPSH